MFKDNVITDNKSRNLEIHNNDYLLIPFFDHGIKILKVYVKKIYD